MWGVAAELLMWESWTSGPVLGDGLLSLLTTRRRAEDVCRGRRGGRCLAVVAAAGSSACHDALFGSRKQGRSRLPGHQRAGNNLTRNNYSLLSILCT